MYHGILTYQSRGFDTKYAVVPCQEQKVCLSWECRVRDTCGSTACLLAVLGCLLTCKHVCVCCEAWLEGSYSPSPLSLIMQGKNWVRPGGWEAGRLLA